MDVIRAWSELNSKGTGKVLQPVRWETHTSPELGERPQALINRQIVDQCDMLVGVFGNRLGTPTGQSASGTVEEIKRILKRRRVAMLYFSRAPVCLSAVDLSQREELNKFEKWAFSKGLVETFTSRADFREKFRRQIDLKVRELQPRRGSSRRLLGGTPSHCSIERRRRTLLEELKCIYPNPAWHRINAELDHLILVELKSIEADSDLTRRFGMVRLALQEIAKSWAKFSHLREDEIHPSSAYRHFQAILMAVKVLDRAPSVAEWFNTLRQLEASSGQSALAN